MDQDPLVLKQPERSMTPEAFAREMLNVPDPANPLVTFLPTFGTPSATPKCQLKIISYNVLAAKFSYPVRYKYVPEEELAFVSRFPRITQRISDINPDVALLQEVDHWPDMWVPMLKQLGYNGYCAVRPGKTVDDPNEVGLAIIWKNHLDSHIVKTSSVDLDELADTTKNEDYRRQKMGVIVTIALPTKSATEVPEFVTIGNVHTYWDPAFEHVKVDQVLHVAWAMQHHIDSIRESVDRFSQNVNLAVTGEAVPVKNPLTQYLIIGGDWNLLHTLRGYDTLVSNLSALEDAYGRDLYTQAIDQHFMVTGQPERVHSVPSGNPKTHYKDDFDGCLDYLFVDRRLTNNISLLRVDTEAEVKQDRAGLPNTRHPSDHIPIGVIVTFF